MNSNNDETNNLIIINDKNKEIIKIDSIPERHSHSVNIIDKNKKKLKLLVFAGMDSDGNLLNDMYVIELSLNKVLISNKKELKINVNKMNKMDEKEISLIDIYSNQINKNIIHVCLHFYKKHF